MCGGGNNNGGGGGGEEEKTKPKASSPPPGHPEHNQNAGARTNCGSRRMAEVLVAKFV